MKKIRLGNTIDIVWEIFLGKDKDKGKYDLTGKKLTIYLVSAFDRIKISDFTTEFNVLRFTFEGKEQKHAGRYQITFVENEGGDDTRTLDKCDAFELVRGSCMETDDLSEITLTSSFDALRIYPIIPQVGPNRNWWVDGVDTGKSSVGLTAYEFAKENGYEGTEEEYAAECLAVPVLNEGSRIATAAALEATEQSIAQQEKVNTTMQGVQNYMDHVVAPAITSARQATENAENAAEDANSAAESANKATEDANASAALANSAADRVDEAIEAFGPAIANKADLENGKIIVSQLPDYILGQVMYGGLIYDDNTMTASSNFISKYGNQTYLSASDASKYSGVFFIASGSFTDRTIVGVPQVSTGDWIISTGKSWAKVDNSDAVTSVAGLVGNVNASALASVLADLKDANSLARKSEFKTINGQSLVGTGDIKIEGKNYDAQLAEQSAKLTELDGKIEQLSKTVYVWNWDGSEGGAFSQGEFDKMRSADIVAVKSSDQMYVADCSYAENWIQLLIHTGTTQMLASQIFTISPESWQLTETQVYPIPTKVSELDNDSKFVEEENLATINGKKLTEGGDIIIEGSGNVEVVDSLASDAADKALSAKQGKVLKTEMDAKAKLDETGKIVASQLPDYILGQVMFGGKTETLVNGNLGIRPSASFAAKFPAQYYLSPNSFSAYEGVYFIVGNNIEFADLTLNVGDWLISTGEGWEKVDNTDAVSLVAGLNGNIPASALAKALAETAGAYALAFKSEIVGANAYITDFTVQDLDGLASGGEQPYVDADLSALEQALTERRIILVPYDSETPGYGVLVGVADDFLYMRVITAGTGTFEIEATRGDDKIYGDKVTKETVGSNSDSSVYITDFTIQDLEDAVNSQIDITANLTLLEAALAAHKVILVPYPADDGYLGYGLLSGYAEDLLYCTVYVGFDNLFYDIEAVRGDTTIRGQLVYKKNWSDKQDSLVSGENIKTINGQSLLGEGNIDISGGSFDDTGIRNYDLNVKAINHRGYSYESPENTIPAYIMSKQKGFTYVEGDVSFTKDSVAVLLHDATIDRTSNGTGDITKLNYQEVLQYDFGSWFSEEYMGVKIPTFKEWMICCKNLGLHPYIELKSAGGYTQAQIAQVVNEVEECGMKGKVTYISFSNIFLGYVKNADASARLGLLANPLTSSKISQAKELKTATNEVFLDAKLSTVTDALISTLLTNDQPLEVWTVNTEEEILKMPSYVSGVTSDFIIAGKVLYENSLVYVPPVSNWKPTTSISLDKSTITIVSLEPITLIATVEPSDSSEEVVWKSSNTSVATVNNGIVTPITDGSCTITATSGDFSASCSVNIAFTRYNVVQNLTGCTLSNTENNVLIGKSWTSEIMPNDGYSLKNGTVKVTMGGVDVTSTVYSNGIITIDNVAGDVVVTVVCVAVPVYTITRNLVGCTSNKSVVSIGEGNPYNEVFTALEDYRLNGASVTITMGGVDISSMYSDGVLNIAEVTGDLVISIAAVAIPVYSITRSLTNCVSNKDVTSIKDGESYTETLTANDGYTLIGANVVITMNGVDITSTSYFNGVLNIDSVNGDINIRAEAAEAVGPQPVVDLSLTNAQNGKTVNLGTGGSTYDASVVGTHTSDDDGLHLVDGASVSIPFATSLTKSFTWIVKGSYDEFHSSNAYQRLCRGDNDVPSAYYRSSDGMYCYKLIGNSGGTRKNYNGFPAWVSGQNNYQLASATVGMDVHTYAWSYDADSDTMSFYADGVLAATQTKMKTLGKAATALCLGNNQTTESGTGNTYYAPRLTIKRCLIYDTALTADKIAELQNSL